MVRLAGWAATFYDAIATPAASVVATISRRDIIQIILSK